MARIIVIDDEDEMRNTIQKVLTSAGHLVFTAADGREGLELHRAHPADLVMTDLIMPRHEGVETIRELLDISPKLPIIAMSGQSTVDVMSQIARQLGVTEVLQKPFDLAALRATVGRALAGAR